MGFILAYIFAPTAMSQDYFFWVILVIVFCLALFFGLPDNDMLLHNRILKHSNLLILSIVIVNFQYPIDYVLGNSLPSDSFIWVNETIVPKSLILSSIGLLSFLIGYLLFSSLAKKGLDRKLTEPIYTFFILKIFALLSLITYFYTANPLYLGGGYGIVELGAGATYASLIFYACIIAIVVQCSRNIALSNSNNDSISLLSFLKKIGYSTLILILIYLLSVVVSGDRGPLIIISLIILGGYLNVSGKRFSLPIIISLLLIASFSISLLGVARSFDRDLSFKERIEIAYSRESDDTKKSISSSTQELATSINTLHYVVNYIPERHDYLLGKFQLNQLIYSVPFASGIYHSFWSEEDLKRYLGIATFITWIAQGDYPSYGNGASLIADFYVSAGLIGIVLGMLLTGFLIRKSEYVMYTDNLSPLFWHIFSIVYFSNMIYLGRSSLLEGLKLVFLVIILITVNRYFAFKVYNDKK